MDELLTYTVESHCEIGYEEMPYCCGIRVLGETMPHPARMGDQEFSEAFGERLKSELLITTSEGPGLFLYSIADNQRYASVLKKVLLANQFKVYERFRNPNTGNMITLYGRKRSSRR